MNPLKIVIVSSNCYPYLSPRSHRATQLAIELAQRGNEVILYSLLGDFDYTELQKKTGITFKNLGVSKFGLQDNTNRNNNNFFIKLFTKIFRKPLAFPFIEFIWLVTKKLKKEKNIDLLITLAHPHSIHWSILFLRKKTYKCWIADCGDPFMGDPLNYRPYYFKYIEKKWCKSVNFITIPISEAKEAYYKEFHDKIKVIPQGFNFEDIELAKYTKNLIPTFAFSGVVYESRRDPRKFLEYLSTIDLKFKFIVYTKNKIYFNKFKELLGDKLEIRDYVPREKLLFELSKMDFLINIKNESEVQSPSKLIDYYLTERPILEITTAFNEKYNFELFFKGDYSNRKEFRDVEMYNIKNVVDQFLILTKTN